METILNKESRAAIELMIADGIIAKDTAERYFPELKESEDERIRKDIVEAVELHKDFTQGRKERIYAWLEKQGEHANFRNKIQIGDKVTRNEDGVLVNLSQLKRAADKVEPKFKVGDAIRLKNSNAEYIIERISDSHYYGKGFSISIVGGNRDYELVEEQKSAWSEEDEGYYNSIIEHLKYSITNGKPETYISGRLTDWLKSLKERVQQKREWSEEDEKKRKRIMHRLSLDGTINNKELADINDLLKSPRPQKQWKPSEEQIEALVSAIDVMIDNRGAGDKNTILLSGLYHELKALYL